MLNLTIRVDPVAIEELKTQARYQRARFSDLERFRSTEAGKAQATAMWRFWTAVLSQIEDAEQVQPDTARQGSGDD